jgi:hypothetical protein
MKKLVYLIILFGFHHLQAQPFRGKITIVKEDSTLSVINGDTSYIYNAFLLHPKTTAITTLSITAETWDTATTQWVLAKDTSYTWSSVSITGHNNAAYKICKPNANTVKICLGRLYFGVRKKHTISFTENNRVLTKEFDF